MASTNPCVGVRGRSASTRQNDRGSAEDFHRSRLRIEAAEWVGMCQVFVFARFIAIAVSSPSLSTNVDRDRVGQATRYTKQSASLSTAGEN